MWKLPLRASDPDLQERLGRLRSLPISPPPALHQRLRAIPAEAGGEVSTARVVQSRRWLLFAAPAAAAVVLLLLLTSRPTPAFAEVERALQATRTAHWTETITQFPAGGAPASSRRAEHWARTEPPARLEHHENGLRILMTSEAVRVYQPYPVERYTRSESPSGTGELMRRAILYRIITPAEADRTAPSLGWKGSRSSLNGTPAIRFTREYQFSPAPLPQAVARKMRIAETVWVDVETYRVLRTEQKQFNGRPGRLEFLTVGEGFRYDQASPPGAFEWRIPPGKQEDVLTSRSS